MELAIALVDSADVDARDVDQRTPHIMHVMVVTWSWYHHMALVDRGADVHATDVNEMTPLHDACGNGNMELAMALVDRGADVDARDVDQSTPLHKAWYGGNEDGLWLLCIGVPMLMLERNSRTILHKACLHGNMRYGSCG